MRVFQSSDNQHLQNQDFFGQKVGFFTIEIASDSKKEESSDPLNCYASTFKEEKSVKGLTAITLSEWKIYR